VFFEFVRSNADREASTVDRRKADFGQDIGQSTDMVFVPVGQHNGFDFADVFAQIIDVWEDQIDAEHFGFGEHHATIQHNNVIAVLDDPHIAADLTGATEGNHT